MGINPVQLESIARLASAKGFTCLGRYASRLNGKQVVETMFRNADGIEMKVIKDAVTGQAISRTTTNAYGSFTKTYLNNGGGQVQWNELFKAADGTVLKDIDRQTALFSKYIMKNGKPVNNWTANQVYNIKKDALLDKLGNLVGYDSRYAVRNFENLVSGDANIRRMVLNTAGTRIDNYRGITLAGNLPRYRQGAIYAGDGVRPTTQLSGHYDSQTLLEKLTGPLHQWATRF